MLGIKHETKPIITEIKNNHHSSFIMKILFKLKLKLASIKFEIKKKTNSTQKNTH